MLIYQGKKTDKINFYKNTILKIRKNSWNNKKNKRRLNLLLIIISLLLKASLQFYRHLLHPW